MNTITKERTLTRADRCDRCGAQAYIKAELASGELLFCNHHGQKALPKLEELNAIITDESEHLN